MYVGLRWFAEPMPFRAEWSKLAQVSRDQHEAGNSIGTCNLGVCYLYGMGVAKTPAKAVELFRSAAVAEPTCRNNLGVCYWQGLGGDVDERLAFWCFQGAQTDCPMALANLGRCYDYGACGVLQDEVTAVSYYRRSMQRNCDAGRHGLAISLRHGTGVAMNGLLSMHYLSDNTKHWYFPSITVYVGDLQGEENDTKAFNLALAAAEESPKLQVILGNMYRFGRGTDVNLEQALCCYKKVLLETPECATARSALVELEPESALDELLVNPDTRAAYRMELASVISCFPDVLVDLVMSQIAWQPIVNEKLDIQDTLDNWMCGRVLKIEPPFRYFVAYDGWSDKWHEWIDIRSGRLLPLNTHEYPVRNPVHHPKFSAVSEQLVNNHYVATPAQAQWICCYLQECQQPLTLNNAISTVKRVPAKVLEVVSRGVTLRQAQQALLANDNDVEKTLKQLGKE